MEFLSIRFNRREVVCPREKSKNSMAPKKTVATSRCATRVATRTTMDSSSGRPADLMSTPADTASGLEKWFRIPSKEIEKPARRKCQIPCQRRNDRRDSRSRWRTGPIKRLLHWTTEEEAISKRYLCVKVGRTTRFCSSAEVRGPIGSIGRLCSRTRLARSPSGEAAKGRAACTNFARTAVIRKCDRRRLSPAKATLSRRTWAECRDVRDIGTSD